MKLAMLILCCTLLALLPQIVAFSISHPEIMVVRSTLNAHIIALVIFPCMYFGQCVVIVTLRSVIKETHSTQDYVNASLIPALPVILA